MSHRGPQNILALLILWLFTLPAVSPLIQPTLTDSADGLLHLYRLIALEQAVRQGELFPRWLPDLAFGYGFPLFIFYAPLAYYITLALSAIGFGPVLAQNASFGLALLVAGTGVYLLMADRFGPKVGLLTGVAYVYAPFQLNNALFRGGLPAAWALALYPLVFWAFGRLVWEHSWRWLAPTALMFGLALLTHNTLTLLFVPFLGCFLSFDFVAQLRSRSGDKHKFARHLMLLLVLTFSLGLGLAAFFLIPAIIEQQYAQVQRVITSPDFDFRFHFVNLRELFVWLQPANTGLLNPKSPLTLGLAQLILAGLGLFFFLTLNLKRTAFTALQSSSPPILQPSNPPALQSSNLPAFQASKLPTFHSSQSSIIIFALVSLLIAIVMMLPLSRPLWEILPVIEFVQFPHRFLGPAALVLAILTGSAVAFLPKRLGFWLTGFGLTFIFLGSIPLLYPRYHPVQIEATIPGMFAYERANGAIGTTSFGEYLPIWVEQLPRESPLERHYITGSTVGRLDQAYLPLDAVIESAAYDFNQTDLVITSPEPFQAIFHTFYFPGWTAILDGQTVPIGPFSERGLIQVTIPAGQHKLQLSFQDTLLRWATAIGSFFSLFVFFIIVGFNIIHSGKPDSKNKLNSYRINSMLRLPHLAWFTLLALVLIAAKLIVFDRIDTPLKHSFDGNTVAGIDVARRANFGNQVDLLGYDLSSQILSPGQTFELTIYWQARQPLEMAYSSLAQLVDAEGNLYGSQDNLHPGALPTNQWLPWGYVRDPHPVRVPFGTPPGDYRLAFGLYDPTTWQRLPILNGGNLEGADTVTVPVTVQPSEQPVTLEQLDITWPVKAEFGELRLLGASTERETIQRNDFLRVALFWEAVGQPTNSYQIQIRLQPDQANNQSSNPSALLRTSPPILQSSQRPAFNRYPTTVWASGERVRDNHAFWIPTDFPAGKYRLQARVVDENGQPVGDWVEVGLLATN